MKIILIFFVFICLSTYVNAQQISLYDKDGEARAYIDYDQDATIFLWDGTPVAFIKKDGGNACIFDFRSGFFGWYKEGIVYDKKGFMVGARKDAVSMMVPKFEGMKGIQKMTPIRSVTPVTPMQPILMSSWSNTSLTEFLYWGE